MRKSNLIAESRGPSSRQRNRTHAFGPGLRLSPSAAWARSGSRVLPERFFCQEPLPIEMGGRLPSTIIESPHTCAAASAVLAEGMR